MYFKEPQELRIHCRNCEEVIETIKDINPKLSLAGSKICTKCAPLKEVRAYYYG
jgi:hypothetical protein